MKATSQAKHMILGQVYTNEVTDPRIFQALMDVNREDFLPPSLHGAAYVDDELEVVPGRSLMSPLTFAQLLNLAEITPDSRVLVIGGLTGYYPAVVARLCSEVVVTEKDPLLIEQMRGYFKKNKVGHISVQHLHSLADGYASGAPYDVIMICGAINFIPEKLGSQLGIHGRLVTIRNVVKRPGIRRGTGRGLLVRRADGHMQSREYFDTSCSLLADFDKDKAFIF